jgi:N6-L-threonylcarbamoyladenine synthase
LAEAESKYGWKTYVPKFEYTTDNAAMIGIVGYYKYLAKEFSDLSVTAQPRYKI